MRIPKIETLLIVIFFISISLWAASKCSSKRAEVERKVRAFNDAAAEEDGEERRPVRRDTVPVTQPATVVSTPAVPSTIATPPPVSSGPVSTSHPNPEPKAPAASTSATPPPTASGQRYPALYVTIDQLNVRKKPGLEGNAIAKLKLYEQVYFLNEKTSWTQEISLGKEKVTDHWVKIRTKSGKEGWVFGAGVHYYKTKHPGASN